MNIAFIASFVPRKCGIATYTYDITKELLAQGHSVQVIAMKNDLTPEEVHPLVSGWIQEKEENDYRTAAIKLNNLDVDVIHIQHEFGLFGGEDGEYILQLAYLLKKPIIITFHTILLTPTVHQKFIIQELTRLSRKVIIMDEVAKGRLETVYGINPNDSMFILHGAPLITKNKQEAKEILLVPQSFVLLANNLLSRNKGLEYAITSIPEAIKEIPNLIFFIVGETHPVVRKNEGESYREELMKLVHDLKIEEHVIFVNTYVPIEQLEVYLAAADVYITPYLDPEQITSGTLSYAIGAGKACIATEYIYAKDMLAKGRGILVPFRDSRAIELALTTLYKDPKKLHDLEENVTKLRKDMQWPNVGKRHSQLYKKVLQRDNTKKIAKEFTERDVDTTYLLQITDEVGVIQHMHHIIPNRKFGYSTDDNARALIVASLAYKQDKTKSNLKNIYTYTGFLQYGQEPDGTFHTFLNYTGNWIDTSDVTDPYGKSMWALGFSLFLHNNSQLANSFRSLFTISMKQIPNIRDLRTAAYTILGLYYYILASEAKTDTTILAIEQLTTLANFIVSAFEKHQSPSWEWFEETVTYDNFRLPQALFAAFMITDDKRYRTIGQKTLQFITECNFDREKKYFDFVGQDGWYAHEKNKAAYDQQPLEAAAAVDAYLFAAQAFQKKDYVREADLAFEWFFGNNRNHTYIYDELTKGVYDGLTLTGVNENEGAESIVCFLISQYALQQYNNNHISKMTRV
jgi:glycosyltransferase involved in cell wall biosynthesis